MMAKKMKRKKRISIREFSGPERRVRRRVPARLFHYRRGAKGGDP
jgi:hypothetical protein